MPEMLFSELEEYSLVMELVYAQLEYFLHLHLWKIVSCSRYLFIPIRSIENAVGILAIFAATDIDLINY